MSNEIVWDGAAIGTGVYPSQYWPIGRGTRSRPRPGSGGFSEEDGRSLRLSWVAD